MSNKMLTLVLAGLFLGAQAQAGVVKPDCSVEKAAKSAATKATVGVGGRCTPAKTAKQAAGLDKKGPVEKKLDDKNLLKKDETPLNKAGDKVKDAVSQ